MQLKLSDSNMERETDSEINNIDEESFSEKHHSNYYLYNPKSPADTTR